MTYKEFCKVYLTLQRIQNNVCSMPSYICDEDNYDQITSTVEGVHATEIDEVCTFLLDLLDEKFPEYCARKEVEEDD